LISFVENIGKKRLEAALAIAGCAASGGTVAAAPTPCGEVPKQFILTASDVLMYVTVWKIYFEEELSQKEVLDLCLELGIITVVAAGTAYVAAKGSTALLKEVINWVGPVGWGVGAALTGSLTGFLGAAWALYCDQRYCQQLQSNSTQPPALTKQQAKITAPAPYSQAALS
jgi:hypothetical protein